MATADPITPPPARRVGRTPRTWTPAEFAALAALPAFAGRPLALAGGTIVEHHPDGPRPVRFTRDEFYALLTGRLLAHERVRLIRGVLVQEPPMNPPHATGVRKATKALERVFTSGFDVRCQLPLYLEGYSQPEPDVAVVTGSIEDYAHEHPTTAVLVVEVSDETLFEDTTTQTELYASAGLPEYWVVDIPNRRLRVFRDPAPIPDGGAAYRSDRTFAPGDRVSPLAAPGAAVAVADLLP
jgi:Uma2 family endonuclease